MLKIKRSGTITAGAGQSISINVASFTNQGAIQATGGGTVSIGANSSNSGTVSVGTGSVINFTGNLTQSAGTVSVVIDGTPSGQMGVLNISGSATLGGTLNASFVNGFAPSSGSTFKVLTFGSRSGAFQSVVAQGLAGGHALDATYDTEAWLAATPGACLPRRIPGPPALGYRSACSNPRTWSAASIGADGAGFFAPV